MYAYIKGTLEEIEEGTAVIENGGIGYRVRMPSSFQDVYQIGEEVKVYTYLNVREDAMELFGFSTRDERSLFILLIGVNGIGPKGAVNILSTMHPDDLKLAILNGDAKAITKAQGVGAKTAQRLIIELKDKLDFEDTLLSSTIDAPSKGMNNSVKNDVILALTALGYQQSEALSALKGIEITEDADSEDILKQVLKQMI